MPEQPAASATTTPQRAPDPGYVVQREWLNQARRKPIQVRLNDGKVLKGQLVAHDNYTLSVKLEAAPEPILLFKHAIAYLTRLGETNDGG